MDNSVVAANKDASQENINNDQTKVQLQELKLFWENFLQCSNDNVKVEWLELFLFKYGVLIKEARFSVDNAHFLSTIPSQLSCYLLKLVYGIISAYSVAAPNSQSPDDSINSIITIATTADVNEHHDVFGDLFRSSSIVETETEADNVAKSNDITTIAALRDFLVKGIGGRMLHVLESIDTKGLLCGKELATLLMSLFPTNLWDTDLSGGEAKDGINDYYSLSNAIEDFEFQSLFSFRYIHTSKESTPEKHESSKSKTKSKAITHKSSDDKIDAAQNAANIGPHQYHTPDYHTHQQAILTGDCIASTILNIVLKLIAEESTLDINKTSASVQALWFAINQCHIIENNRPFQNHNHELLKRKLLVIVYSSLNKICMSGKKLEELVDTNQLLSRFIDALQDDCQKDSILRRKTSRITHKRFETVMEVKTDNMKALIYCIFLISQHLLLKRTEENNLFEMLFNVIQKRVQTLTKAISILVRHQSKQRDDLMDKTLHVIFKLIYILNSLAVHQARPKKVNKQRKKKNTILPVAATHHQSFISFRCTLEMILLHTAQNVGADKLRTILTFFQKHTICCCNINLAIIHRILLQSLQHNLHKVCLHFIKLNVLRTIYNNDMRCGNCDTGRFIFKFKDDFVTLYKNWFRQLRSPVDVIVFLKHIAKIAKYPQVDVQSHILVDIVLPLFRKEKHSLMAESEVSTPGMRPHEQQTIVPNGNGGAASDRGPAEREISDKIITACLNIFLCYLQDVTVIKAFFIAENIQHLEDLFVRPQFAYLVSNIFKIGIDNGNFLGECDDERVALCDRLESLQIDSFRNIMDAQIKLFDDVSALQMIPLKTTVYFPDDDQNGGAAARICATPTPNPLLIKLQANKLTSFDILHLSVVYWNTILQILRSSHDEFKATMQQTIQTYDNIVFNIVYNSLSCVLFAMKPNDSEKSSAVTMAADDDDRDGEGHLNGGATATDELILNQDEWKIGWLQNGDIDCDNNILFRKGQSPDRTMPAPTMNDAGSMVNGHHNGENGDRVLENVDSFSDVQLNGLLSSEHSDIPSGVLHIQNDIDFHTVIKSNKSMIAEDSEDIVNGNSELAHWTHSLPVNDSQLSNGVCDSYETETANCNDGPVLKSNFIDLDHERSLIYSIRNAKANGMADSVHSMSGKANENGVFMNAGSGMSQNRGDNSDSHGYSFLNSVQKINKFISTNVIDIILSAASAGLGNSHVHQNGEDVPTVASTYGADYEQARIPQYFTVDQLMLVHSTEHKKLLMQLFEITLGVLMCNAKSENSDTTMNTALQQLKLLLLAKSVTTFDVERGTAIVNTLQSLLKVAEMRNKCCFMDDCAHPTLAQKNKFSVNISLQDDRILLLSGHASRPPNEILSTDFDVQSDEESASDNSFETAGDGYEGDAEVARFADSDMDSDWSESTKVSTPPFRNHIVHEGICKVVIDILIDLSKRCVENPQFWPNHLMQIATRLVSIRDLIGGPLYILKGFGPVLESNDMRLRDFQKSILDLVTDLNTPDTFCAYLSLLTDPDPPLDILLNRLIYLGTHTQSIKPSIEIEFPLPHDDNVKFTCDKVIFEDIKKIQDQLDSQKIRSALTQAAYIAPLNFMDFKPWSIDGFTLTSWLHINEMSTTRSDFLDTTHINGIANGHLDDSRIIDPDLCSPHCFYRNKVHLFSVGTSSLLLSIYICVNDVNTLYFQLTNPSAQPPRNMVKSSSDYFRHDSTLKGRSKPQCVCTLMKRRRSARNGDCPIDGGREGRKKNRKTVTIDTGVNGCIQTSTAASGSNVLSQTIHTTKLALKSSLSHFNLFSSGRNNDLDSEFNLMGYPLELKGVKLNKNKWMLFSMATTFTGTDIQLTVKIDNSQSFVVNIPCSHSQINSKYEKFKVLCIGSKVEMAPENMSDTTSSSNESINTSMNTLAEKQAFKYSMSNVLLFRKGLTDREILANIFALGPDCVNFTQCQIGNIIPNLGVSNCNKIQAFTPTSEILKTLRENLVVAYSAHKPDIIVGYNNYDDILDSEGESIGLISMTNDAVPKYVPSFHTAIFLSGGLSSLLYLFARVVELSKSDVVQAAALKFLLHTAHSNSVLYTEFVKKNYIGLLGPVIRSEKCIKGIHLLNSILDTACSMPVITKGPDGFELLPTKNICIVNAELFISVINHYSDWHHPKNDTCQIIEMLFKVIQALVSEKHLYQAMNIARLNKANLVPALLSFCKVHLTDGTQSKFLSKRAADTLINIISIFAGAPPQSSLLDDIVKVLLMLHRPSDSFVTHDRSRFYFLLTSAVQSKVKKLTIPLGSRKISLTMRKDLQMGRSNKSPVGSPSNATLNRSASLNHSFSSNSDSFRRSSSEGREQSEETIFELDILQNGKQSQAEKIPSTSKTNGVGNHSKSSDHVHILGRSPNIERRSSVVLNASDKTKFEKAMSQINFKRQHGQKKRLNNKRKSAGKSRSRTQSIHESDSDRSEKGGMPKRCRKRSVSEGSSVSRDKELEFIREYDIIAEEDVCKIDETCNEKEERCTLPSDIEAETTEGIIRIQNGLLKLLHDFILILPDTAVGEVLNHYVTFDIVLVLANNANASVRASIISLLAVMCDRNYASAKPINLCHLGNQIALHQAEFALVQACVQWVTGSRLNIEHLVLENELRVSQKWGLNALIAIIPQTLHDVNLAKSIIKFMNELYKKAGHDSCAYMVENGLIPSIVKTLSKMHIKRDVCIKLIEIMQALLNTIAFRAISTAGGIQVLWDLLNGITYVEQNKSNTIFRGIRAAHAEILLHLLKSFFTKRNNPSLSNFKFTPSELNLYDSILSINEKQTRLDLLLDRIVQFLRNANPTHSPSPQESTLIESMIMMTVNGVARTGNIIPWSLRPGKPMPIKLYTMKMIWKHSKNNELPINGCDGKMFKTMVHGFLHSDREIIPPQDLDILLNVCNVLGVKQSDSNSYLPHAIEKMDANRDSSLKEQKPFIEKSVFKFEQMASNCIESAMKITRNVVEVQNAERRSAMAHMRFHDESCLSQEWNLIIDRMTHEGAPWHSQRNYSSTWELDQTEGPSRVRLRMKRSNLNIASRFFRKQDQDDAVNLQPFEPLGYLKSTLNKRPSCTLSDQVLYTFPCKHLPVDTEIEGELIITEFNLIFISNNNNQKTLNMDVNSITDIWLRRYQHNENAAEIFLDTNNSLFFIFQSPGDRDILKTYFSDRIVQCPDTKLNILTQQWREGQLSNWEYLTALNLISGRTYQDLMQYPIFPWVLSDYESATLDLNGVENYRNLAKPIAIQHSDNEDHYINSYNYLNSIYSASNQLAPYHYGSHYSNSGTVLHFLVRIPPFTQAFLSYQDNNFDLPDRTFHSITTTWRLASRDSTTDVKELIPEFFSFFEFLENSQKFNFGFRQSGESVDDVALPPWARDSPRLFTLIHRQALESDITRKNLNNWIDLVFGFKQSGQAAVDAVNVFHPATYYGFSLSDASDPVERTAMETMVRTYGQMPKQLFKSSHPSAQSIHIGNDNYPRVLPNINGLHWGCYTGSPELPDPRACCLYQQFEVNFTTLMSLPNTNCIYAFSQGHNVMQGSEPDTMNIIQWQKKDGVIRIKPLRDSELYEHQPLTYNHHIDEITSCGTDANCNQLWFGHVSGRITVYQCIMKQASKRSSQSFSTSFSRQSHNSAFRKLSLKFPGMHNSENDLDGGRRGNSADARSLQWKDPVILVRHTNTVTGIHICKEFKIVVSVSNDGFAVIWDANHLQYVRSIQRSSICKGPISLVTVSPTLGDIVTVHSMRDGPQIEDDQYSDCYEATEAIDDGFVNVAVDTNAKSLIRLHTINARYLAHGTIPEKILSVCYSSEKEGVGVNVIATGLENGIIRLWSSWDLTLVREFLVSTFDVISVTYTTYQHLVVLTSDNIIQVYDSPGLHGNPPKFPQIVFQNRNNV